MNGEHLTTSIKVGLAIFYLLAAALNIGFALHQFYRARDRKQTLIWSIVAGVFVIHAVVYLVGLNLLLPQGVRDSLTRVMGAYGGQMGPILYTIASVVGFILLLAFRRFLTQPIV